MKKFLLKLFGRKKPQKPPCIHWNYSGRFYIRHRETGKYLGECHTTGDGFWTPVKAYAESFPSYEAAYRGLEYHPFYRIRDEVVEIVET